MQENITHHSPLNASTLSNAAQAVLSVESTIVERVAVLEVMIRVIDDICEQHEYHAECRVLNGLSFLLRETSAALSASVEALEIASREVRACHAC